MKMNEKRLNDSVDWYISELTHRVVAASGNPEDRFHLGKLILQSLRDTPEFVLQIDGAKDLSETCGSVLERSVRCANALKEFGLQRGDAIVLMAPNHLDLCIPYYAALYLGVIIAPLDRMLQIQELQNMFAIVGPKFIFCEYERAADVRSAVSKTIHKDAKIVTFNGKPEDVDNGISFEELLRKHGEGNVDEFKASDFNPEETIALLVSTSGTTGLSKQAAITHKNFAIGGTSMWRRDTKFPNPTRVSMIVSPHLRLTAAFNFNTSPLMKFTRLQSSLKMDQEHAYHLINTYKPTFMFISPTMLTTLLKPGDRERCDFTSFETILIGGSAVAADLVGELKKISPKTEASIVFAMTETCSSVFTWNPIPLGSCGKPVLHIFHRLVDITTQQDINEPNQPGELWVKGPTLFKSYYKNQKATQDAFSEDGWFKTGDMFYRDENWNFYFVERIKLLMKYRNHQISPVEIQNVIRQHPGVLDAAVTGIPDQECGELPVAFVVPQPGSGVNAQEIKDLVKAKLTDTKQLRGGVVFLESIPVTATSKFNYRRLKELAVQIKRE